MNAKNIIIFIVTGIATIGLFYGLYELVQAGLQELGIYKVYWQVLTILVVAIIILWLLGKKKPLTALKDILQT